MALLFISKEVIEVFDFNASAKALAPSSPNEHEFMFNVVIFVSVFK